MEWIAGLYSAWRVRKYAVALPTMPPPVPAAVNFSMTSSTVFVCYGAICPLTNDDNLLDCGSDIPAASKQDEHG